MSTRSTAWSANDRASAGPRTHRSGRWGDCAAAWRNRCAATSTPMTSAGRRCASGRATPPPHPRSSTRYPAAETCELDKGREPQVEKLWTKAGMKCEGIVCDRLRPVCLHETSHSLGGASYCRKAQLIDPDWLLAFAAERYWVQYVTALIPA